MKNPKEPSVNTDTPATGTPDKASPSPKPEKKESPKIKEEKPAKVKITPKETAAPQAPAGSAYNPMDDLIADEWMKREIADIHEGQVVKGKVISADQSGVIVDIGYKSEGMIPPDEMEVNKQGKPTAKPGDILEVFIGRRETQSGFVELSKKRADQRRGWLEIRDSLENHKLISGKIISHSKFGFLVEISGIEAFMPHSQSGLPTLPNMDKYLHKNIEVFVLESNPRQGKIIVSHKQVAEEERDKKKKKLFEHIKEGDTVKGTVKSLSSYGAFVDIGGIDGLLHVSDMDWKPVQSPASVLKIGQKLELLVLKVDLPNERISLGLKQLLPNPWDSLEIKYPIGTTVPGKVVSLTEYGAFVELESGIEGMIHVSEMSWVKRIKHPSEVLHVKEEIQVKILNIDKNNKRISLGLKQCQPDPWDTIEEKYPVGTIVKGKVTTLTEYGAFVMIEEGIEGLIHMSDLSWIKPVKPSECFKAGQEIEARVIKISKSKRRLGLGYKQISTDPWLAFCKKFKEGDIVTGIVTKIVESGIIVDLGEGVEGFCRISQLDSRRIKDINSFCKPGDSLQFKLTQIQKTLKRISISRRELLEEQDQIDYKSYVTHSNEIKTNLGELLERANSDFQAKDEDEDS